MSFKPKYILAEEAEERIVALYRKEIGDAAEIFNTAIDVCQSIILDMYDNASAEVEPVKHGRWKPFDLTWGRSVYACTSCGEAFEVPTEMGKPIFIYCPHCGAKMDLEGEEA